MSPRKGRGPLRPASSSRRRQRRSATAGSPALEVVAAARARCPASACARAAAIERLGRRRGSSAALEALRARKCSTSSGMSSRALAQRRHAHARRPRGGSRGRSRKLPRVDLGARGRGWSRRRRARRRARSAVAADAADLAAPRARAGAWAGASSGSSPISSRNRVPPCAASKAPARSRVAPVKAPRSWPKSSLSIRSAAMRAAVDDHERARRARGAASWMRARRRSSLPVPVSPVDEHGRVGRRRALERGAARAWRRRRPSGRRTMRLGLA